MSDDRGRDMERAPAEKRERSSSLTRLAGSLRKSFRRAFGNEVEAEKVRKDIERQKYNLDKKIKKLEVELSELGQKYIEANGVDKDHCTTKIRTRMAHKSRLQEELEALCIKLYNLEYAEVVDERQKITEKEWVVVKQKTKEIQRSMKKVDAYDYDAAHSDLEGAINDSNEIGSVIQKSRNNLGTSVADFENHFTPGTTRSHSPSNCKNERPQSCYANIAAENKQSEDSTLTPPSHSTEGECGLYDGDLPTLVPPSRNDKN